MKKKDKKWGLFHKYVNGTKGVISLFLAILMMPFVTIAGVLVNAGRINSAVAIFDEALCNASNSTLGTYDEFLRNRFGLMAFSQNVSDGGSKYGAVSKNYSVDSLLGDVFTYYMRENLGTLSNTYSDATYEVTGLYPLADEDILLPAVLDASKYTIPTKAAIDWFSLDDLLKKLTKGLDVLGTIAGTSGSVADTVTAVDAYNEAEKMLREKVTAADKAETAYINAYNAFASAASAFNALVNSIYEADAAWSYWQGQVNTLSEQNKELISKIEALKARVEWLEDDVDEDGNTIVHTDTDGNEIFGNELEYEITVVKEEIEKLEYDNEGKLKEYNYAVDQRDTWKKTYNALVGQFSTKRQAVIDAKDDPDTGYYVKIVAFRDAVSAVGSAVVDFQNEATNVVNKSLSAVGSIVSTTYTISNDSKSDLKNELVEENKRYDQKMNEYVGNSSYTTNYYNMKQENISAMNGIDNDILNQKNQSTLVKEGVDAVKDATSELSKFAEENYKDTYRGIFDKLNDLAVDVSNKMIPSGYSTMTYEELYINIDMPVTIENIDKIVEEIENSITDNLGWKVLKAVVSFLRALFEISFTYEYDLTATVNNSLYSANGGLPSKIDRTKHTLISPYDQEDAALSQHYKDILNAYSSTTVYSDNNSIGNIFEQLMEDVKTLSDLMDNFKLSKAGKIGNVALRILNLLVSCKLSDLIADMEKSMYSKFLLVGYISYNTANRTTYSGSALTGQRYNLPKVSDGEGYLFSGAETEYIYNGGMNEKTNQEKTFSSMWIMRSILEIAPVVSNTTVQSLATAVSAVPLVGPILMVLVYLLFIVAEGFVSTVILANGGQITMAKYFVYITPGGINKLIDALFSLKLDSAMKKTLYEKAGGCVEKMASDVSVPRYDDYVADDKSTIKEIGMWEVFSWDYTKTMQILLLLFRSSDTMVERLADIIQMESTYYGKHNDIGTYDFNLDNSYTYLRAAGSFESTLFMKLSDETGLTSTKRIVYKGY